MKRKSGIRWMSYTLAATLFTLVALDTMLWKIDPSGIVRYYHDYNALSMLATPAPDGIRYTPGLHQFSTYSVTINDAGMRAVPANQGGACRIAFVGDSVTFGMGSDISFVDILAPDIDAAVINAAFPGYNAGNAGLLIDDLPADGYVWLIIQNDDDPPLVWRRPSGNPLPAAMTLYQQWLFPVYASGDVPKDEGRFVEMAAPILARPDVLAFVFEGQKLTDVVQREFPQVETIAQYTGMVSKFDPHPNANGHQQIADSIRDQVAAFAALRCA